MDKRQYAGFLIKQISEKTDKKIIRTFKKYGVTCSQHRLLVFLDKSGGKSTQKDVETYLEVSLLRVRQRRQAYEKRIYYRRGQRASEIVAQGRYRCRERILEKFFGRRNRNTYRNP